MEVSGEVRLNEMEEPDTEAEEHGNDAGNKLFQPRGMTIAGLQHIIQKMMEDVHRILVHWKICFKQLNVVEPFLCVVERRQRYTWTCLRHTAFTRLARGGCFFKGDQGSAGRYGENLE